MNPSVPRKSRKTSLVDLLIDHFDQLDELIKASEAEDAIYSTTGPEWDNQEVTGEWPSLPPQQRV